MRLRLEKVSKKSPVELVLVDFKIPESSDLLVDFDNWKLAFGTLYFGTSFAINCVDCCVC